MCLLEAQVSIVIRKRAINNVKVYVSIRNPYISWLRNEERNIFFHERFASGDYKGHRITSLDLTVKRWLS
jgi:hypothetical protein